MSAAAPPDRITGENAALEVLLLLAEADARWQDYRSAVRLLDMAERAAGELPDEFALKRARWVSLARLQHFRTPG
jgi:hypothetical protein